MRKFSVGVLIAFLACGLTVSAQPKKLVRNLAQIAFVEGWHNWLTVHKNELPVDGKFEVYFDSAYTHIGLRGEMLAGLRTGTWTSYHLNGRKCEVSRYAEGKYNGAVVTFSVRGDTTSITPYSAGARDGRAIRWAEYPWKAGRYIAADENSSKGVRDGWQLRFDWNGDTLFKAFWKDGILVGKEVTWYNGQVISEGTYEPGKGVVRTYPKYKEANEQTSLYLAFVTYKNKSVEAFRKLDSLSYYTNLQTLTLEVDADHVKDIPAITEKLKTINSLKQLHTIGFAGEFTEIPAPVFTCQSLEQINLCGSIKTIPNSITTLKNLHSITIGDQSALNFPATLKILSKCPSLKTLRLPLDSSMRFPKEVGLMKNLYNLSVGGRKTCGDYYSAKVDFGVVYTLTNLRSFEVCSDEYWKTDQFEFARRLPNCQLLVFETCFSAGARILLSDRTEIAIEDVKVGDRILSYNELTGAIDTTIVTKQLRHYQPIESLCLIKFTLPGNSNLRPAELHTTATHPFYVNDAWIEAGALRAGDRAIYYSDLGVLTEIQVESVEPSSVHEEYVYNLSTENHTYFVNGVLVHNK